MIKPIFIFTLLSMLLACGKAPFPILWNHESDKLDFNGVLHHPQADIPIQGVIKKYKQEIRYAIIIQNGILIGTGRINMDSGHVNIMQHASSAGSVVMHIGTTIALFLNKKNQNLSSPWKKFGNQNYFQDNQLELMITTQESKCLNQK